MSITRDMVYAKVGGRELCLDLYRPKDSPEPLPLIIWIHGGAWRGGSKNKLGTKLELLKHGYALASVEYRLSKVAVFPAAIEDCKAAVSYLRANAEKLKLDPKRFGAWGSSAGGHLVALMGTTNGTGTFDTHPITQKASSDVQAVCDWYGPTDFLRMNDFKSSIDHDAPNSPESQFVGGPIQERKEQCAKANPITYVTTNAPPFLIMHGTADASVPYNQSELLQAALKKVGADTTLYAVERGGHGFGGAKENRKDLQTMARVFFDKHFKGSNDLSD